MMLLATAAAALAASMPIPFDAAARAGLPRVEATLAVHGSVNRCEGVALAALAARAGLPTGDAIKGAALTTVIVAEAADGYRVAFSLGEIDPKLGNTPVFVADRCNGAALPAADGPLRLIVPGESRGARSLRQLVGLSARELSR